MGSLIMAAVLYFSIYLANLLSSRNFNFNGACDIVLWVDVV